MDYLNKERLSFLNRELSPREKAMLTEHLDAIRELERRVAAVEPPPMMSSCQKPNQPNDPPQGSDYIDFNNTTSSNANVAYSNEDLRMELFNDLIVMAFKCDIARYGTYRQTWEMSLLNTKAVNNVGIDIHQYTHFGWNQCSDNRCADDYGQVISWLTNKYFSLCSKLQQAAEGSGNILDNSAIIYTAEGGGFGGGHGANNMCTIVAGKAGGLKTGQHVNTNGAHPVKVLLSCMRAVGWQGNQLGEISGYLTSVIA